MLKAIKFSKKIIITMFVSTAVFTTVMIVLYLITGGVPDTLIVEFFGFFKLEGGALGIIKVAETIIENVNKQKERKRKLNESKEQETGIG